MIRGKALCELPEPSPPATSARPELSPLAPPLQVLGLLLQPSLSAPFESLKERGKP